MIKSYHIKVKKYFIFKKYNFLIKFDIIIFKKIKNFILKLFLNFLKV